MSITNPLRVPVWDDWSLANDNDGARTNGGLLIPLLIVAGCWLAWALTTTDHHTKGDQ